MEAIVSIFGSNSVAITFPKDTTPRLLDLKHQLCDLYQIPIDEQRIQTAGGLPLGCSSFNNDQEQEQELCNHEDQVLLFEDAEQMQGGLKYFALSMRMAGGKGGFGSMLRAQGGRMNSQKTTNTEACRDLSGRRIKTVNEAKKMAEYVRGEPERKKARKDELKRKIEEKLELADRPMRKHRFEDAKFFDESEEQVEEVKNAVAAAIKESLKAGSGSGSTSSLSSAGSASSSGSGSKGKGKAKKADDSDDEDIVVKKKAVKSMGMWDDMSDYESSEEENQDVDDEEEDEEEEEKEEAKVEEVKIPSVGSSTRKRRA
ncbi:MAG: telomere stability and silencing-domain-containing protein [Linnemannia gamsii]|nr:MAG: telomere stability and silencing-domain-containing protein [Linnemannia gamsii]